MRADLLDAQAAVDWAIAQIPLLHDALNKWGETRPYRLAREPDSDPANELIVAYQEKPFPLTFNAWVGAVINSLRSSLDLIAAALAQRNGVVSNSDRHFPIFASELDMIDPLHGLDSKETKKWLSDHERAAIKTLKPYKGGDESLSLLHHMDIVRKHTRLVRGGPAVHTMLFLGNARVQPFIGVPIQRDDHKTVLGRIQRSAGAHITKGNTFVTPDIFINEPALGIASDQAFPILRRFSLRVRDVISLFDN